MNTATTTAPLTTTETAAPKPALDTDYLLRAALTGIRRVECFTTRFSSYQLTNFAQELSTNFKAIAEVTTDERTLLALSDIQDELIEILPPNRPDPDKMILSLSIIRSMIAEVI